MASAADDDPQSDRCRVAAVDAIHCWLCCPPENCCAVRRQMRDGLHPLRAPSAVGDVLWCCWCYWWWSPWWCWCQYDPVSMLLASVVAICLAASALGCCEWVSGLKESRECCNPRVVANDAVLLVVVVAFATAVDGDVVADLAPPHPALAESQ